MYQGINIEAMEQVEGVKLLPFSTRVLGMKLRSGLAAKCHYLLSHLAGPRCFLGSSDSNSLKGIFEEIWEEAKGVVRTDTPCS